MDTATFLTSAKSLAKDVFGIDALTPEQLDVLGHVAAKRDCLAVLPTGSGKTMCYALPALMGDGLVLVVSPLIALMRDQWQKLTAKGVDAVLFDSHQDEDERSDAFNRLTSGKTRVLFVSPERLSRQRFQAILPTLPIKLIAIDEAHCVSLWGSQFRPEYRRIGHYLRSLVGIPRLALTATATERTQIDIVRALGLNAAAIVWADWRRHNLSLDVVRAKSSEEQLDSTVALAAQLSGPGIVYVSSRVKAEEIAQLLRQAGLAAAPYHAGLNRDERQLAQDGFASGRLSVIVATSAFGLGIDKDDIRYVLHCGLPGSPEQYIQEVGRAGRDGTPAKGILVYGPKDFYTQKFMLDRTLPDLPLIHKSWHSALRYLEAHHHVSQKSLAMHLKSTVSDDAEDLLEVIFREGLLYRLIPEGSRHEKLAEETLIVPSDDDRLLMTFWGDYEARRVEQTEKLRAIRNYARGDEDRETFLREYFGAVTSRGSEAGYAD